MKVLAPAPLALALASLACGGAPTAPVEAATGAATDTAPASATGEGGGEAVGAASTAGKGAADAAAEEGVPTTCTATSEGLCMPPAAWVKKLCAGTFPDATLALFAKGSPFSRAYLRGNTNSNGTNLVFDEEILVVGRRAPAGGMQVSGASGYVALRWDGACVSLDDGEVTLKKPPAPKSALLAWRTIGEKTRDALLADAKVLAAYQKRGKECKGATSGEVTKACETADKALSAAVVDAVRAGAVALPKPEKLP